MSKSGRRILAFVVVVMIVVVFDQATKAAARAWLADGKVDTLISGIINLKLVKNTGAAFSIGEGAGVLFVIFALVVLAVGSWVVATRDDVSMPLTVTIACICGGGLGNMIDRVMVGYVTDFLSLAFMDFPVFNVADVFVTCGVIVFLLIMFFGEHGKGADEAQA